jgi:hypothetical protein
MELKINIEDYLTHEEIKNIVTDALRESIISVFRGDEANINRLISNLSYEFIFEAVSDAIGEDAQTKITNKVKELLEDENHIRYELWRKNIYDDYESPAIPMLHKAIKDNEDLIRAKVVQSIDQFKFDGVQDAMYNALNQIVYDKVFGKEGADNA